jgi:sphingolipid delta-4 desaturase
MSFFYSLRPFFKKPKSPSKEEIFNIFVILASDYLVYTCFGGKALLYLIGSTFFSIGMHPVAGNFIGEHYEFVKGLETYDYIGILNIPNLNLGYHIEHHDFPEIPWTLLPQARKIAPEFYENIPIHTSYVRVIYEFIFNKNLGLFSRIDNSIQRVKEGIADNSTKSTKTQKVEDEKNK